MENQDELQKAREVLQADWQWRRQEFLREYRALCAKWGLDLAVTHMEWDIKTGGLFPVIEPVNTSRG